MGILFQKALSTALDPRAIREMRESISGGIQSIQDSLLNPTVGIFSFAKSFNQKTDARFKTMLKEQARFMMGNSREKGQLRLLKDETFDDYIVRMETPLKVIGATLGPLLQEMANLFSTGGTLMGKLSYFFFKYFINYSVISHLLINFKSHF